MPCLDGFAAPAVVRGVVEPAREQQRTIAKEQMAGGAAKDTLARSLEHRVARVAVHLGMHDTVLTSCDDIAHDPIERTLSGALRTPLIRRAFTRPSARPNAHSGSDFAISMRLRTLMFLQH